jgi:hypothetical protein
MQPLAVGAEALRPELLDLPTDDYPTRVVLRLSAASPCRVSSTLDARICTSPPLTASSQMERRGQLVGHASIVSRYVRGAIAIHMSRSRVSGVVSIRPA